MISTIEEPITPVVRAEFDKPLGLAFRWPDEPTDGSIPTAFLMRLRAYRQSDDRLLYQLVASSMADVVVDAKAELLAARWTWQRV